MTDPHIAQRAPYVMDVEPGKYAWCACGKSQNQPYCDGSHAGSEFTPTVVTIEDSRKVAWCGCKHTGNKPFCDGTHGGLT